jgi:hypothetical protein
VTALSLAAQAWPASNEAPRPVTQPGVHEPVLQSRCNALCSTSSELVRSMRHGPREDTGASPTDCDSRLWRVID